MPLIDPITQSKDQKSDWSSKLLGKKISDGGASDNVSFAKSDLPAKHRVVKEGDMTTMDHVPDRLNVHVGSDGTVRKVTHG